MGCHLGHYVPNTLLLFWATSLYQLMGNMWCLIYIKVPGVLYWVPPFMPIHGCRSGAPCSWAFALACSGVLVATAVLPSMRCTAKGKGPWTSYHLLGGCFLGHFDVRLLCTNGHMFKFDQKMFQWLAQVGSLGHPMRIPRVCELDGSRVWVVGIAGPSYLYEKLL